MQSHVATSHRGPYTLTLYKAVIKEALQNLWYVCTRKNKLNTLSIFRQITSISISDSAKSSGRANEMRRVHPTYLGYICIIHSPEGEKVGINKQMSIFANICHASSSEAIKQHLIDNSTKYSEKNIKNASDDAFFLLEEINHSVIFKYDLNVV